MKVALYKYGFTNFEAINRDIVGSKQYFSISFSLKLVLKVKRLTIKFNQQVVAAFSSPNYLPDILP